MMRIILVGQGPFGDKVLDVLVRRGEDVVGVFCPNDKRGDAMAATAEASRLALFRPDKMKDGEVRETYLDLSPDLVVLAFVTDIIPETLLDIPAIGTICYHPSLLPKHRGASGINWAVIQGDTRTGLTILWVDEGIDTGPILIQKEIEITPEDTTGSLYFSTLFPLGIEAVIEAVDLIKNGKAPRIPQDDSLASYEPPCDDKVAAIDWSKPATEIYNLVRGCDPQPGAFLMYKGAKVRLYKARLIKSNPDQTPGEIMDISEGEMVVALKGGALGIGKVRDAAGAKMDADEFAAKAQLKTGMNFGS
jgi:methionyl-tRNA formyltransferase